MNWDDLRLVGAIAEHGSMAAAARALELDHSTVFRRLNALERSLGVRLFERTRRACEPTPAGARLARAARLCADAIDGARLEIEGLDARISGRIRATITPYLAHVLLVPLVADFTRMHPQVRVDLTETHSIEPLMQRSADLALRITRRPPDSLIAHHLGTIRMAVYGSRERYGDAPPASLSECDWVVQSTQIAAGPEAQWIRRHAPGARIRLRVETGTCVETGIAAGIGIGVLPCFRADRLPHLVRIGDPVPEMDLELWALTRPPLHRVARIRAIIDFLRSRMPVLLAVPETPNSPAEEPETS